MMLVSKFVESSMFELKPLESQLFEQVRDLFSTTKQGKVVALLFL